MKGQSQVAEHTSRRQLAIIIIGGIVTLFALITFLITSPLGTSHATPTLSVTATVSITASPEVRIATPQDGQIVPVEIIATGTAQNLAQGQELWIVVEPRKNSLFYPQAGPVIVASGLWTSSEIFIGRNQDAGQRFDILAVLADQQAQREFSAYLSEGQRTGSYRGLGNLPPGTAVAASVAVTRS